MIFGGGKFRTSNWLEDSCPVCQGTSIGRFNQWGLLSVGSYRLGDSHEYNLSTLW